MAEALSQLSDFFSYMGDVTGIVGDKSEFAVHGLTRDADGALTYTRVKFADSETLDLTNEEGFVYGGMEDIINGNDVYNEFQNQYEVGEDTFTWEERLPTNNVRVDSVDIVDPGMALLASTANVSDPTADFVVTWSHADTSSLTAVKLDFTGYVQSADVSTGGLYTADGLTAIIDPPFKDTGLAAKMTLTNTLANGKYSITAATVTDIGSQYAKRPNINFIGGGTQETLAVVTLNMAYMVKVFNFTGFVYVDRTASNKQLRQPSLTLIKTLGETGLNPTATVNLNAEDLTYWCQKDILFGDTVTLTAFSPTLNRTENLVNGTDYNVVFEESKNTTKRIQLTGTYVPYTDDVFILNVEHPAADSEYNNKYKKQGQIRFDNNKLYYFIDGDGMLVARYAEVYDYGVGPQ